MRLRAWPAALAAVVLLFSASGAQAALRVFACVPEWGELLRVIGGDAVTVTTAISPLQNPDTASVTPQMISDLQQADLLVCTGLSLEETWLPQLLDRAQNPKVAVDQPGYFLASRAVTLLSDQVSLAPGSEGEHHHAAGNPHIQGDPRNVMKVAGQLARRMSELDPDNAQLYADNARTFIRDLGALVKELEAQAAPLKGINVAVQHESSLYLLTWLGMRAAATVETQPMVPPGPAHLAEVIDKVGRDDIKFVLYAPFDDPASAEFIAEKSGIPVVMWPFTIGGAPDSTDFPSFYRDIVTRLTDALGGTSRQ
jgi:zinc/manganese transport system substrate-binding protein